MAAACDQPLSAVYFEPSIDGQYLQCKPESFRRVLGHASTHKHRAAVWQNVASTSSMQYTENQSADSPLPFGTVPTGHRAPPAGTVATSINVSTVSIVPSGTAAARRNVTTGFKPSDGVPVGFRDPMVTVSADSGVSNNTATIDPRASTGTVATSFSVLMNNTVPSGSVPMDYGVLSGTVPVVCKLPADDNVPATGSYVLSNTVPRHCSGVSTDNFATYSSAASGTVPAGSSLSYGTSPVGSRLPSFHRASGLETDFVIPAGTVPSGSKISSCYQPVSTSAQSAGGSIPVDHEVGSMVVEGRPLVVSGFSCPLCGRQDYHVHPDSVLVNGTTANSVGSGVRATAAVNAAQPQATATLGPSTFPTRG